MNNRMKTFIKILTIFVVMFISACGGQSGQAGFTVFAEQPKTVRAYAPEMNNMEMLSMTQQPGWRLLAGTQWIGNMFTNSIKGVNESLNANFYFDSDRRYMQSSNVKSGATDQNHVYLNVMSAANYLDFVFRRQFPNVKNARRTKLKTIDQFSEAERQQLEEQRVELYNTTLQFMQQTGGTHTQFLGTTADRSEVEYKWVQDGDTIVHLMGTIILAAYTNYHHYGLPPISTVNWSQGPMLTITAPTKNVKKVEEDIRKMFPTMKWNEQYMTVLSNIVWEDVRRKVADIQRMQGEMAQAQIRHQQRMSQILQETHEYTYNVRREAIANRQASQQRINQGWRDVVVGVDRFMGTDGKVVEVPVSAGHNVWQNAESGTIYSSDSYLFRAVDYLPDKDGIERQFRQLQLMK